MKTLAAAIPLDALLFPHGVVVRDSLDDYSRLPYTNRVQDHNSDNPYLGETVLNQAFQDKNLFLDAGVHLHWAFPRGMTKIPGFRYLKRTHLDSLRSHFFPISDTDWEGYRDQIWDDVLRASGWIKELGTTRASVLDSENVDQGLFNQGVNAFAGLVLEISAFATALVELLNDPPNGDFVSVPDIWIINRVSNGAVEKTWIRESGYLSASQDHSLGNAQAINIPYHDDQSENKTQPFRYLGRALNGDNEWNSSDLNSANYLKEITAIGYNSQGGSKGYGEPTFAAFYPNCHSVFGFHDPEITVLQAGMEYEVLGLYSNPENDYLKLFLEDLANRYAGDEDYYQKLNDALADEFLWKAPSDMPIAGPANTPGHVTLFGKATPKPAHNPDPGQIEVALGNTNVEALSALLADQVDGDKGKNEELFESIQFASKMHNQVLDIGAKVRETRHEKSFISLPGGTLWSIRIESEGVQSATESNPGQQQEVSLPETLSSLLNEANTLQANYDEQLSRVPYERRQLYADWYKYMIASYPATDAQDNFFDPDDLMVCIREESMGPLKDAIDTVGLLYIQSDERGRFASARAMGPEGNLAAGLAGKLMELEMALLNYLEATAQGQALRDQGKRLALRSVAAPRYWRANDPVVLLAETLGPNQSALLRNDRYATPGAEKIQEIKLIENLVPDPSNFTFAEATAACALVREALKEEPLPGNADRTDIWNPIMMEWAVEYLPAYPKSNLATADRKYTVDYVRNLYELRESDADLNFLADETIFQNGVIYSGSSILTPYASIGLGSAITAFVDDFGSSQSTENMATINAAQSLLTKTNTLSQSLGGFNEALCMQKQSRQLDIADPLGFPQYQSFSVDEVAPLVGPENLFAPRPFDDFHPIRNGLLKIVNLRLIDSFGQTLSLKEPSFVVSEPLKAGDTSNIAHLKPRFCQAAQLSFRFLSAISGEEEMNAHPASSPICGWILPNHLDPSLVFYDQDGTSMGALTLDSGRTWTPAPSTAGLTSIGSIGNIYLRRVATELHEQQLQSLESGLDPEESFLVDFLKALDQAQEHVDPENFAEHEDLAILIGEPIAVVRTRIHLKLAGPAVIDQSWGQTELQLQGHERSTDGFEQVQVPIRIGNYQQLNDGVLGYWLEDENGKLSENYFSAEAEDNQNPIIQNGSSEGNSLNIQRSLMDDPLSMTMLVNPKGSIQAATGMLPTKSISIPQNQYKPALRDLGVTFLTAPVLVSENHLQLSLPKEPGFEWNWLEKDKDRQWEEIAESVTIHRDLFESKFRDQPQLWESLLMRGWLHALNEDGDEALVTTDLQRAFPPNTTGSQPAFPIDIGKRLDDFFDSYARRIEPFESRVTFGARQTLREGWLQLTRTEDVSAST